MSSSRDGKRVLFVSHCLSLSSVTDMAKHPCRDSAWDSLSLIPRLSVLSFRKNI